MPVVEYKMHAVNAKGSASAPLWIDDGGYHSSPIDKTKVGWVLADSDRDYYVPDTVITLSKSGFLTRQHGIHAVEPLNGQRDSNGEEVNYTLDSAGVDSDMGLWYDSFVSSHSS